MCEEFDERNNQTQDEEEDSETLSYSYPSYSRFTYTGKTRKSRLGRNRFMRQTVKEESNTCEENISSGSSITGSDCNPLESNSQLQHASWLHRDSIHPSNPFDHGVSSVSYPKSGHGCQSDLNTFPSHSNFLFSLKSESNLPFSTTPFKSRENKINHMNHISTLRGFNNVPENPFSKLKFSRTLKVENKENLEIKTETKKTIDFDPPWSQLKKICDAAISYPALTQKVTETEVANTGNEGNSVGKIYSDPLRSSLLTPFSTRDKVNNLKKDEDSSNAPLDLSSAENLTSKSATDHLEQGEISDTLINQPRDLTKEKIEKTDNLTIPKTNTDAISSFLPKFLAPTNRQNNKNEGTTDDLSNSSITPPSVGTVVENNHIFNLQHSGAYQKSHEQLPHLHNTKSSVTSPQEQNVPSSLTPPISSEGCELQSSFQYKPPFLNSTRKTSPPSVPGNNILNKQFNNSSPPVPLASGSEIQSSSQHLQKAQDNFLKKSPPSFSGNMGPLEPMKRFPLQNIPDPQTSANISSQNQPKVSNMGNDQIVESLAKGINLNLDLKNKKLPFEEVSSCNQNHTFSPQRCKSGPSEENIISSKENSVKSKENLFKVPSINDKNENPSKGQLKIPILMMNSINQNNVQQELKEPKHQIIAALTPHGQISSSSNVEKNNGAILALPVQETKPLSQINVELVDPYLNQIQEQPNAAVSHHVAGNGDLAVCNRQPENVHQVHQSQRTYLAPQQPHDSNQVQNFIKPEVPQVVNSRQCFPTLKKQNQMRMSAPPPRGMPSRADTELFVNGKVYTILSMLGKGGSSEVYQVIDQRSSKLLAVKCVDLSMVDKTIADGYLNEIELLSKLQGCASVIKMFDYEYVQEFKMLYVVMEKGDTDLSHLIRDISKTKKISMSMIIYYWTEMLQAVKDIHDRGIIHSDLKPANFLLVSGRLKLIDFGIASSQGDMTSVVKEVTTGTWNYMSPEAIKNTSNSGKGFKITYKSDVWSLGCILYNLVYGKTPFSHITNTWGKLQAIADPNHCIEFPSVGTPAVLASALRSCFNRDPKQRPTVAELLSLPYHSSGESDVTVIGKQVQALLPSQWWLKVAHLFPELKTNKDEKNADSAD